MTTHTLKTLLLPPALLLCLFSCEGFSDKDQPRAQQGVLDLRGWSFEKDGPVKLDGEWEFYWRELIDPAEFQPQALPGGNASIYKVRRAAPALIKVPGIWNDHEKDGKKIGGDGYATYHLTVLLDKKPAGREPLAVEYHRAATAFQLLVNGKPVGSNGTVGRTAETSVPQYLPGIGAIGSDSERLEIVIHVSNFHHQKGGVWAPFRLGLKRQLLGRMERKVALELFLFGCILIMGLFNLGTYSLRREPAALYFGLFCLLIALRALVTGERFLLHVFPNMNWEWAYKLEYLPIYLGLPLFAMFFSALYPEDFSKIVLRAIQAAGTAFALIAVFTVIKFYYRIHNAYLVLILAFCVYVFIMQLLALFRKREGPALLMPGQIVLFIAVTNDILNTIGTIKTGFHAPAGLLVFIFNQSLVVLLRFSRSFVLEEELSQKLAEKSESLEGQIWERTVRLFKAKKNIEKSRDEINQLNEFLKKLNSSLNLDETLKLIFEYLESQFKLEATVLVIKDTASENLKFFRFTEKSFTPEQRRFINAVRIPLNEKGGVVYKTFRRGRPFYLPKVVTPENLSDRLLLRALNLASLLLAPLAVQDEPIGMVCCGTALKELRLSKSDIKQITFFCNRIAGAVQNALLLDEIRSEQEKAGLMRADIDRARSEIKKLNDFSVIVNASRDLDEILDRVLQYFETEFDIDGSIILLHDREKNELFSYKTSVPPKASAESLEYARTFRLSLARESGAIHGVFHRRRPFYLADTSRRGVFNAAEDLNLNSFLLVPFVVRHETVALGMFTSYEQKLRLSKPDIARINRFCEQIAGAVYRASLLTEMERERKNTDRLLKNALPAQAARELKETGSVKPRVLDSVTILSTDFKGFTKVSENMLPEELVEELNIIFQQFDQICEQHNMEKLKTIGDAYVCAGGLLAENPHHAADACLAALKMLNFIKEVHLLRKEYLNERFWDIRIGIHTGKVAAGVIGKNKFAYDVWGDAVYLATFMESSGAPNRINISEHTYHLVKEVFKCKYRGARALDNRDNVNMYFLDGLKAKYAKDKAGLVPNENLYRKYESDFGAGNLRRRD